MGHFIESRRPICACMDGHPEEMLHACTTHFKQVKRLRGWIQQRIWALACRARSQVRREDFRIFHSSGCSCHGQCQQSGPLPGQDVCDPGSSQQDLPCPAGSNKAGRGGKVSSATSLAARVAAATQQRQKLEAILQQDRENLILEQSRHAGSPHAELHDSQVQDMVRHSSTLGVLRMSGIVPLLICRLSYVLAEVAWSMMPRPLQQPVPNSNRTPSRIKFKTILTAEVASAGMAGVPCKSPPKSSQNQCGRSLLSCHTNLGQMVRQEGWLTEMAGMLLDEQSNLPGVWECLLNPLLSHICRLTIRLPTHLIEIEQLSRSLPSVVIKDKPRGDSGALTSLRMQNGTWEANRLRVKVTSLAAENDALRLHVRDLLKELSCQQSSSEVRSPGHASLGGQPSKHLHALGYVCILHQTKCRCLYSLSSVCLRCAATSPKMRPDRRFKSRSGQPSQHLHTLGHQKLKHAGTPRGRRP